MPIYAFLLHGRDLLLIDTEGVGDLERGGVYCWRSIEAENEDDAAREVIARFKEELMLCDDVWNESMQSLILEIEEVEYLETEADDEADSGYVFYVEED